MPKFVHDGQQLHLVSAVMVTSRGCRHFLDDLQSVGVEPVAGEGCKKAADIAEEGTRDTDGEESGGERETLSNGCTCTERERKHTF